GLPSMSLSGICRRSPASTAPHAKINAITQNAFIIVGSIVRCSRMSNHNFARLLIPHQAKDVHDDRLIGLAVGVIAALMTKNINASVHGLKTSWVIAGPICLAKVLEGQAMPRLSLVFGPINTVCGDMQHDSFARGQQFRMAGVFERSGIILLDRPGSSVLLEQTLPTHFLGIVAF